MLPALAFLISQALASNWDTYPSVPQTASINGFADPIYSLLPTCAKSCVTLSTSSTPCPYWDTGCLCVMPQWAGTVAECWASSCSGSDLATATSLAYSLCTSAGADMWLMPASVSTDLSEAVGTYTAGSASSTEESGSVASSESTTTLASSSGNSTNSTVSSTTSASATGSSSSSDSGAGLMQSTGIAAMVLLVVFSMFQ